MKLTIRFAMVVLVVLLIFGCAPFSAPANLPTVPVSQATRAVVPTLAAPAKPTPLPAVLAPETVVLTWQRSGGLAGFCDDLTIHFNGLLSVGNCKQPEKFSTQLSPENLALVRGWVQKFQSFHQTFGDRGLADGLNLKLDFSGVGALQAGDADRQAMSTLAAELIAASRATPVSAGDYPAMVSLARQALAVSLSLKAEQIEVLKVEPVEWPDACLGISKPEMLCAMVVTPGYRVRLRANGSDYEYHTDASSNVVMAGLRPVP